MKKHGEIAKRDYPKAGVYTIVECYREDHNTYKDVEYEALITKFEKKEDRDMIFDAMKLGGYCGHSTKSWIRSIPPVEHKGLLR